MPMRSFSLSSSRRTRTCVITLAKSPLYSVISSRKIRREAGQRSPRTGIWKPASGEARSAKTFSRHSSGMSKSGSSFIGELNTSRCMLPSSRFFSSTQAKV